MDHDQQLTITLRPLRADEFDGFLARCEADYAGEIERNMRVSPSAAHDKASADLRRLLPDGLDTERHHVFAIERNGERVGELWMGLTERADGLEAFGYDFHIRPELRDAGIGRRAMALAAQEARRLGAIRLALNVFGENERALHLYRSFGFEVSSINMVMPLDAER